MVGDEKRICGLAVCLYLTALAVLPFGCQTPRQAASTANVEIIMNGAPAKTGDYKPADIQSLILSNGLLSITFGRDTNGDFSATSVIKNGQELAHNLHGVEPRDVDRYRTFYLDYGAGRGHLQADVVKVISSTPDMAHFAVIDTHNPTYLEHHFIMRKDQSGVYGYVIIKTPPGRRSGEMRTMYRFDRDILDWAYTPERTGQQTKYADLEKLRNVQDETWELPDGTIYQKYDYSVYYSEASLWGHYGHGFGVFFMPVSTESYAGGPMRQELVVHQDALILNYIGGGHYGGGGTATGLNGQKMHGPWFLYFNTGATPEAIVADAKKKAAEEQTNWPYPWVEEPLYPLERTKVTGQLKVTDGRSPAGAWVVLAKPGGDVYTQGGDFIFSTKADKDGRFTLPHVRAGTYALYAWANQGSITHQLEKDGIEVKGAILDLGTVEWSPPYHKNLLFQIGKSDRMSGEFKFGNEPRNIQWIQSVPTNLTFTVGASKDSEDWYFAQGKVGHWDINFNLDKTYGGNVWLSVPLAGGGGGARVTISVNGQDVMTIAPNNDASTYRAALRSARYLLQEASFPASLLKQGQNTVRFNMTAAGGRWNGLMYDTVILEAD
jgi:rhamnogalacturonan endolyase